MNILKELNIKNIDALTYHNMGQAKHECLNMEFISYKAPTKEEINEFSKILKGEN